MKLLLVEDNLRLQQSIEEFLEKNRFLVETASDYEAAFEKLKMYAYDIYLIDINLPDGSGLDLIREIKKDTPEAAIIVISARDSLDQKIEGIELGADDYITKPFELAELAVRVKSLHRRKKFSGSNRMKLANIELDSFTRQVFIAEHEVKLTKSEYQLLLYFFSNPNRTITKESLAEHIWGDHMDLADSFDFIYSHVKNLRRKIVQAGHPDVIKAVYGIGYKLEIAE